MSGIGALLGWCGRVAIKIYTFAYAIVCIAGWIESSASFLSLARVEVAQFPARGALRGGYTAGWFGLLESRSPLYMAVDKALQVGDKGSAETVQALLAAGADPNQTGLTVGPFGLLATKSPLYTAAGSGSAETVQALIAAGADPNRAGHTAGFGLLGSESPLKVAVDKGSVETVQALLAAGADPNRAGFTVGPFGVLVSVLPLESAVGRAVEQLAVGPGSAETVQALLAAGANPNLRAGFTLWRFISTSPLTVATKNGHSAVVIALAKSGAVPAWRVDKQYSKLTAEAQAALEDAWARSFLGRDGKPGPKPEL